MILTIIKKLFNLITSNTTTILISLLLLSTTTIGILYKRVKDKDTEIAYITSNKNYYESKLDKAGLLNKTLQLTVNDLNTSKDSVIQELVKVKKSLKIKDKEIKSLLSITTEIHKEQSTTLPDSIISDSISSKNLKFNVELKLNKLTTITVSKTDSIIKAKLDLKNVQSLYIIESKEYRHRYKNFISRLLHFDFKKDKTYTYEIDNSNDLIQVIDTRIINIKAD